MQNAIDKLAMPERPSLPRLERQRLHDTVVEHLRNLIVEGALAPGMKLNERELCETLGISRTPLREAMKVLAAEGLIDITPNRGASVSSMSETEVRETFELMSGLEAMSAELAAERITQEELAEIKDLQKAMVQCRAENDLPGYYSRNQAIHNKISEAARNSVLRQTYQSINRRLQAFRFKSNFRSDKWDRAIAEHEEMIRLLEARDGKRLAELLRHHLLQKRDAILAGNPSAGVAPEQTQAAA